MTEVTTIGLDLAKSGFQAHGADAAGSVVFRKKLRRDRMMPFFSAQPRCLVAMEACASAHYWARELERLGHEVRLIAPAYAKPFVKRQKNDASDAEAICEAAQRPTMRFVAVKSEAKQALAAVFRTRDLLVGQRTQLIKRASRPPRRIRHHRPARALACRTADRRARGSRVSSARVGADVPDALGRYTARSARAH